MELGRDHDVDEEMSGAMALRAVTVDVDVRETGVARGSLQESVRCDGWATLRATARPIYNCIQYSMLSERCEDQDVDVRVPCHRILSLSPTPCGVVGGILK